MEQSLDGNWLSIKKKCECHKRICQWGATQYTHRIFSGAQNSEVPNAREGRNKDWKQKDQLYAYKGTTRIPNFDLYRIQTTDYAYLTLLKTAGLLSRKLSSGHLDLRTQAQQGPFGSRCKLNRQVKIGLQGNIFKTKMSYLTCLFLPRVILHYAWEFGNK